MPEQTITRILNPPTTNTATSSYTVAGVDPTNETTGLITKAQLVSGTWFTSQPCRRGARQHRATPAPRSLKVGGTVTINSKSYKIVGLVSPTLTGNVADIYFPLSTMQSLASAPGYVNEVLVSVKSSSDVAAVTKAIKKELPGRHGAHLQVARRLGERAASTTPTSSPTTSAACSPSSSCWRRS